MINIILFPSFQLSFEGFARYLMDGNNSAVQEDPGDEDLDQPLSRLGILKLSFTCIVDLT